MTVCGVQLPAGLNHNSTSSVDAAPVRGGSSTSPAPPSPPQQMNSMAMELEDRCPICLDSWDDVAYVMPCLHQFCFMCILQWAETKPECLLCTGRVLSITYSLWGDEGFDEPVIPPPAASPVIGDQAEGAPGHPAEPSPAAAQPQLVEMVPAASQGWSPTLGPALSSSPEGDNVGDWPSTSAAVLLGGPSSPPSALLPIPWE
nr:uncharacterized protein LOC110359031 isoform X2 [Columba livia]XP_021143657.1 uncharacterized protein LOC110359031 isoform X2 [Columba livia]